MQKPRSWSAFSPESATGRSFPAHWITSPAPDESCRIRFTSTSLAMVYELAQNCLQARLLTIGPAASRLHDRPQLPVGDLEIVVDDDVVVGRTPLHLAPRQPQPEGHLLGPVCAALCEPLLERRPAGGKDEDEHRLGDQAADVHGPLRIDVQEDVAA